jgi:hypothetical protein
MNKELIGYDPEGDDEAGGQGEETSAYVAPAMSDLGTVTKATLGTNGNDRKDDTEYWD